MTIIAGGMVVGAGMWPLTITAPPELTETRWPSLKVTAEPGAIVCEPMMMAEFEFIEMVCDPSKIGKAGSLVGAEPGEEFEARAVEAGPAGCPVPVPVPVPFPSPGDVAEGED